MQLTLRRTTGAALMAACLYTPTRLSAQNGKDPFQGLDQAVERARTLFEVPGLGLAIIKGDSVIYARGYGTRTIGQNAPVDGNTIFAIGSASKAFTAAAIGILVDEGKARWDDPVTKYLPEFEMYDPYASKEMRLRDLVTHRSGLLRGDLLWYGTSLSREEILRRIRFLKPTWSLRTQFGYQNLMFLTAGQVSARLEGKSWDEVIRDRFFGPLAMRNASTTVRALSGVTNLASPHVELNDTIRTVPYRNIDNIAPAGSINASAVEMGNWVRMWLNNGKFGGKQILSPAQVAEATTPQFIINDPTWKILTGGTAEFLTYGFGWVVQDYRGHKLVHHGGNIDGMSALVSFVPKSNFGVVVLTNLNGTLATSAITYDILDRFLGLERRDWAATTKQTVDRLQAQGDSAMKRREAARVKDSKPSLDLAGYAGTYSDSLYGNVMIRQEGDALTLSYELRPGATARLEHWHFDTFRARWADATAGTTNLTFHLGGDGKVRSVDLEGFGAFQRVPERPR
jgi:CubicO group peptidase (beta-lactamase class C family)